MAYVLAIIFEISIVILAHLVLGFFVSSVWEKEKRASLYGGILFLITIVLFFSFLLANRFNFFEHGIGFALVAIALILIVAATILLFLPVGANPKARSGTKGLIVGDVKRVDERDTVFSKLFEKKRDAVESKAISTTDRNASSSGRPPSSTRPTPSTALA